MADKPFQCDICFKFYKTLDSKRNHMNLYHGKTKKSEANPSYETRSYSIQSDESEAKNDDIVDLSESFIKTTTKPSTLSQDDVMKVIDDYKFRRKYYGTFEKQSIR
jgi:hypothetical protein